MRAVSIDVAEARALFTYDGVAGTVTRKASGKNAVCHKPSSTHRPIAYVCLHGHYVTAPQLIYALVYGVAPEGVRVRFKDRNATNLRRDNLVFASNLADAPVALRTKPAVLKALAEIGRPARKAEIAAHGCIVAELAPYLRLLEQAGEIHVASVDTVHRCLIWALGPGERPAEAAQLGEAQGAKRRILPAEPVLSDAECRAAAHREALGAIDLARSGRTVNSVFALAGRGAA